MRLNNSKFHKILTGTVRAIIAAMLVTTVVHFSWNMALPKLMGLPEINFINAFGLVLLCTMIRWIFAGGYSHIKSCDYLGRKQDEV